MLSFLILSQSQSLFLHQSPLAVLPADKWYFLLILREMLREVSWTEEAEVNS